MLPESLGRTLKLSVLLGSSAALAWRLGLASSFPAPALLQQPRQFPPGSRAHATPAGDSCRFRRTTYSPATRRIQTFDRGNGSVEAVALGF